MSITAIGLISLALNIVFLTLIALLIKKYFIQKKQLKGVVKELDNESLEHYLKEIKKRI